MHPRQQLEFIICGRVAQAVDDYLDGDWSRVQTLFTLSQSLFDEWTDRVELPYGRVFRKKSGVDGVYVLQDAEGWLVFKQVGGIPLDQQRIYGTYREAKRAALRSEFFEILRGTQ